MAVIPQHLVEEIRARARVSEVVRRFGGVDVRKNGREFIAECPFHADRTPSLTINDAKGFYKCFPCGAGGDVFRFVQERLGLRFGEAVAQIGEMVGVAVDLRAEASMSAEERARRAAAAEARLANQRLGKALDEWKDTRDVLAAAWRIWETSTEPPDRALRYYAGRGIKMRDLPKSIRVSKGLSHTASGQSWPGIVARLDGPDGFAGIHRTFLDRQGSGKAPIEDAKMTLGPYLEAGACLRLQNATTRVALAEGKESAFSVGRFLHNQARRGGERVLWPVWAVLCLEGFRKVVLPDTVREVMLFPDADESPEARDGRPSGREAARKVIDEAIARFQAEGRTVFKVDPPEGMDFNDLLRVDMSLGGVE